MRLSPLCLFVPIALVSLDGPRPSPADAERRASASVDRFLKSRETPMSSAVVRRHMVATTRGGSMSAWVDACTYLDGRTMTYRIVGQGGSGSVRKRALIAALDGEVKARRQGENGRATLDPANYEFLPAAADGGEVTVKLRPRRKDSLLIDGSMTLASETGDLLRVEGRLVKPPSIWTRQVHVVRRYARVGSVRVPVSMTSSAQVVIMGASTLNMSYRYLSVNGVPVADAASGDPTGACGVATPPADLTAVAGQHENAVAFHLRRSLDEASDGYEAVLKLDPPRDPSDAQRALVQRLAPRVLTTETEPFALRDVAAVLHPDAPVIAYHLFWDDDIDFPDDNDPSDHEVVWVRYRPDGSLAGFWTYFHGRILDGGAPALRDAAANHGRPAVLVQWGKHGSMPVGSEGQSIEAAATETEAGFYPVGTPITLERYNRGTFAKLSTAGARAADHPLARRGGWPRAFTGSWAAFSRFTRTVDIAPLLRERDMVLVSHWNSATINRRFLRYNFKPKTEWPAAAVAGSEVGIELLNGVRHARVGQKLP